MYLVCVASAECIDATCLCSSIRNLQVPAKRHTEQNQQPDGTAIIHAVALTRIRRGTDGEDTAPKNRGELTHRVKQQADSCFR